MTGSFETCWGVELDGRVYMRWLTLVEAALMVRFDGGKSKIVLLDSEARTYEAL